MPFNLMNGLMAGANFGQGYLQGQEQSTLQNYQNQMNNLTLQDTQLKVEQDQQNAQRAQAMSDYMMGKFQAQDTQQATPVPSPDMGQVGSPQPGQSQSDPQQQLIDRLQSGMSHTLDFADHAASLGDMSSYQQLVTNAANMSGALAQVQQRRAAATANQAKSTITYATEMGNWASQLPDTPEGLAQLKMLGMSQFPNDSIAMQNLANMQWRPGLMPQLASSAMTAAQRAHAQVEAARSDAYVADKNNAMANRNANTVIKKRLADMKENEPPGRGKSGQTAKSPTTTQINDAAPIVAQALYGDNWKAELSGNNPIFSGVKAYTDKKSGKYTPDYNTPAMQYIVDNMNRKLRATPGLSPEQAIRESVQEAKQAGVIVVSPAQSIPETTLGFDLGHKKEIPGSTSFNPDKETNNDLGSKTNPRQFTGQKPSELVKRQSYQTASGTLIWTGTGWRKP